MKPRSHLSGEAARFPLRAGKAVAETPPFHGALALLRAIFDLADADVRADADLLARLTGQPATRVQDLLGWLEHRGLLQHGGLSLTMAGLVAASAIAPSEPVPMTAAPARSPACRAA